MITETEFKKQEYIFERTTQTMLKDYPFVKYLEFLRERYGKAGKGIETLDDCQKLLNDRQDIQEAFGIENCRMNVLKAYEKPHFGFAIHISFAVEPNPERINPRPPQIGRTYVFSVNDFGIMLELSLIHI